MNREDLKMQFAHSLKILAAILDQFHPAEWVDEGCGYQTPVRIAFHTLLGIGYYIGYETHLASSLGSAMDKIAKKDLPTQVDLKASIEELAPQIAQWCNSLVAQEKNEQFPWAGETNTGLALFLIRHTMYHIGELNGLLYQLRGGQIEDLWMKGIE